MEIQTDDVQHDRINGTEYCFKSNQLKLILAWQDRGRRARAMGPLEAVIAFCKMGQQQDEQIRHELVIISSQAVSTIAHDFVQMWLI